MLYCLTLRYIRVTRKQNLVDNQHSKGLNHDLQNNGIDAEEYLFFNTN
jgi:hypothetical protein